MNKLTNLHEPPKPPAQLSWVTAPISIFPAPSGQLYQPQEGFKRSLSAHGCAKRLRAHGLPPRALQPNKQISLAVQKGLRAPSQHVAKILSEEPASQTPPYSNLYLNEIRQGDACRCCFSRHLLEEDQSPAPSRTVLPVPQGHQNLPRNFPTGLNSTALPSRPEKR